MRSPAGDRKFRTTAAPGAIRRGVVLLVALLLLGAAPGPQAQAQVRPPAGDETPAWLQEPDELLSAGDLEGARRQYEALLSDHGGDPRLWIRLAYVHLQLEEPDEALHAAQRAYEIDSTDVDTILMLSQCQAAAGEPDVGLQTLQRGLEEHPENQQLLEVMTTISLGLERWPAAAGLLRQLIRLHPDEASYRIQLGRLLMNQGESDEAIREFDRAAERGADSALCRALQGKAHLAAGRREQAQELFQASNSVRPNSDAYGGMATVHYLRGEKGRAIQNFRKAIELAPRDPDLHFNLGNVLVQTERYEEAEEALRRSLRLDPGSPRAHLNLGVLLLNRFEVSEAEQHLRWAVRLDPRLPKPYLHLGRIAGAVYDYEGAIEAYRRYRERISDPQEKARIDETIAELQGLARQSREALARGEVHLLQFKVGSRQKALDLIERVRQGEDFYVLAQQESEIAETAGVDSGFLHPSTISEAFRGPVEDLQPGEMTPPIETESGYYVFRRVQ